MFSIASLSAIAAVLYGLFQWYRFVQTKRKISAIPTIGGDGFITAYISAWKFMFSGQRVIQEGYDKYHGEAFKVPTLSTSSGWLIVVSGPEMVEELRKAGNEHLSFREMMRDTLQQDYLFGDFDNDLEPYHIDVVRGPLTRGFPSRFADINDEISASLEDLLPVDTEWKSFPLLKTLIPIVCRTSNRLFVGLPLCRNAEYRAIQENITIHTFAAASVLNLLPSFVKPIVSPLITRFPTANKKLQEYLGPLIRERIEKDEKLGPRWEGRPNDLISWLLDSAPDKSPRSIPDMIFRIMTINLAAIHTTSMTLSNAIFDLAAHPEYVAPLRAEVEELASHGPGWTKESMGKMYKLDSFLKESNRLKGLSVLSMGRKVMKREFRFSNGVSVPVGYTLVVASHVAHHDPIVYDDPESFKGFRFSEMRETEGGGGGGSETRADLGSLKHQMVSLDHNYLLFGHGRHACPGRFFAVNELKAILAHILINYDFKLPGDATKAPPGNWLAMQYSPSRTARVLFRKRKSV